MKIIDIPPPYTRRIRLKKNNRGTFDPSSASALESDKNTKEITSTPFVSPSSSLMGLQEITPQFMSDDDWLEHGQKLLKNLNLLQLQWLEGQNSEETLLTIKAELENTPGQSDNADIHNMIKLIRQRVAIEIEKASK